MDARAWLLIGGVMVVGMAGQAVAADAPCHHHSHASRPARPPRTPHDAGYPFDLSTHAVPSDTGHYDGYYVGGGSPISGSGPCCREGTFGWDYTGIGSLVRLKWSGGRRYQGGYGSYATEGPKPLEAIHERLHKE